jgi:hypothetical protein
MWRAIELIGYLRILSVNDLYNAVVVDMVLTRAVMLMRAAALMPARGADDCLYNLI